MTRTSSSDSPPSSDRLDDLLDRFERDWQQGAPPPIEDYLQPGSTLPEAARRELLAELVKIDLGYRWRLKATGGHALSLEDYVRRFPELGPANALPLDLIGEEYWARQRWGDRPSHAEYLARFPQPGAELREALARIDAELAQEFAKRKDPAAIRPGHVRAAGLAARKPAEISPLSVAALLSTLQQCQLLNSSQLTPLRQGQFADARALARELMQRNWLTPYQVNQLLQGKGPELRLGHYLVLERLGEGGAGQVFKARHQRLNRLVALKLIRKDLLVDAEVVGRFQREIQILTQLDHPNIVRGLDSGLTGGSHYLAMEYVEGTDLGRLVKQGGPMPVMQACEYIRQAALGLQHAHERGLVHRDIKPHNLIMSVRDGLIKVADLGLARLPRSMTDDATAALTEAVRTTGTLTPENAVLIGTADYLAPEQALDFHAADIRADIYSLGCTLFCLLTGQPPFPGGNLAQKVARHLQAEPPPVEQLRRDLPAGLAPVLRQMLAKRPEDRYQTPVAVAKALAPWAQAGSESKTTPGTRPSARFLGTKRRNVLAAAVVVFLGLGWFVWWQREGTSDPHKLHEFSLKKQNHLHTIAFSPDGKLAASGGDGIHVWDMTAPHGSDRKLFTLGGPKEGICHLAIAADGRHLAAGTDGKGWQLWDLKAQRLVASGRVDPATQLHVSRPFVGPFAPDGKSFVVCQGEGTISLIDLSGKEAARFQHKELPIALAFSPDSRSLAVAAVGRIMVYDIATGKELVSAPMGAYIWVLTFSPDGTLLAAARNNQEVHLLSAATLKGTWVSKVPAPQVLPSRTPLISLVFSPDGKALATGGWDHQVKLWDLAAGTDRLLPVLESYTKPVCALGFGADGARLFVGGEDDTVRVWRVR